MGASGLDLLGGLLHHHGLHVGREDVCVADGIGLGHRIPLRDDLIAVLHPFLESRVGAEEVGWELDVDVLLP